MANDTLIGEYAGYRTFNALETLNPGAARGINPRALPVYNVNITVPHPGQRKLLDKLNRELADIGGVHTETNQPYFRIIWAGDLLRYAMGAKRPAYPWITAHCETLLQIIETNAADPTQSRVLKFEQAPPMARTLLMGNLFTASGTQTRNAPAKVGDFVYTPKWFYEVRVVAKGRWAMEVFFPPSPESRERWERINSVSSLGGTVLGPYPERGIYRPHTLFEEPPTDAHPHGKLQPLNAHFLERARQMAYERENVSAAESAQKFIEDAYAQATQAQHRAAEEMEARIRDHISLTAANKILGGRKGPSFAPTKFIHRKPGRKRG